MSRENSVGHILASHLPELLKGGGVHAHALRTANALAKCRTAELGGHWEQCGACGQTRVHYNSCGNRHCPGCQGANRERWIMERENDLFDARHFHATFTVPAELRPLFRLNKKAMYTLLFSAVKETLEAFAEGKNSRLNAKIGAIAILHTWTQKMEFHPHIHCIIPAGGLTEAGNWKHLGKGKFLFPVKAMGIVFKAKFCQGMAELHGSLNMPDHLACCRADPDAFKAFAWTVRRKKWVVHCKRPFNGVRQVVEYLGRYTHKIAISNHRIREATPTHVTFSYRDRRDGDTKKLMALETGEFVRRFMEHILPPRFVKIRHFGYFSSRTKKRDLARIRESLGQQPKEPAQGRPSIREVLLRTKGIDLQQCPKCGKGDLQVVRVMHPKRARPRRMPLGKTAPGFE